MTGKIETQVNEMELGIKKIEVRLENNEAKQNTTAQRLEESYKTFLERLNAKDDTTARVREQSDWILKQNDTLLMGPPARKSTRSTSKAPTKGSGCCSAQSSVTRVSTGPIGITQVSAGRVPTGADPGNANAPA